VLFLNQFKILMFFWLPKWLIYFKENNFLCKEGHFSNILTHKPIPAGIPLKIKKSLFLNSLRYLSSFKNKAKQVLLKSMKNWCTRMTQGRRKGDDPCRQHLFGNYLSEITLSFFRCSHILRARRQTKKP
jgi:hypothetical protein